MAVGVARVLPPASEGPGAVAAVHAPRDAERQGVVGVLLLVVVIIAVIGAIAWAAGSAWVAKARREGRLGGLRRKPRSAGRMHCLSCTIARNAPYLVQP